MRIPPAELGEIQGLYDRGLYLQAFGKAKSFGPLRKWSGGEARVLAGRLARNIGAPRLGRDLFYLAHREQPDFPEARYFFAQTLLERFGPFRALQFIESRGEPENATAEFCSAWLGFHGHLLGIFRDFDAADELIARALEVAPEEPWVHVQRSAILEMEDRYEEALAAARRSLDLQAWFRPGVQATAHVLQLLGSDEDALELLAGASERLESALVLLELANLQTELDRHAEARSSLRRAVELCPILEEEMAAALRAQSAGVAYQAGDLTEALELARQTTDSFHQNMAARLSERPSGARRVKLPVGFVRQHFNTCGPATLAAIAAYWNEPVDPQGLAREICYDGTTSYTERRWAEENGWIAREFTVTWEAAVELIDRGIPFTLATVEPGSGHLQAVIGYDDLLRTFFIRDPYIRNVRQFLADEGLRHYSASGPRGMILVPKKEAARLDGLVLPEADLHDQHHRIHSTLARHERAQAREALDILEARAPKHFITIYGRRAIASYDADSSGMLQAARQLADLYPADENAKLLHLGSLRDAGRREERLQLLDGILKQGSASPLFLAELARELAPDAREHRRALKLLRVAMRVDPSRGSHLHALAIILQAQGRVEEAVKAYRFAACMEDKNEYLMECYFYASRHLKQTAAALRFLESRFERFGSRSSLPAHTLFWALEQLDETQRGFTVLEKAVQLRPDDGDGLLFAADAHGRHGNFERSAALLVAAEGKCTRTAWLRTAAGLALYQGGLRKALELWRQVLEAEPLDISAQRSVADLLAATEGHAAAVEHLREATRRFPHNCAVHTLLAEWLRDGDPKAAEEVLRRLLEVEPSNAWALRELALTLSRERRFDEAFASMEEAARLEPESPATHSVLGSLHLARGDLAAARAAFREAIHRCVDVGYAIARLAAASLSVAERRESFEFLKEELARQTILGEGLLAFRVEASGIASPAEILAVLREAFEARPDLWAAWSALALQLTRVERLDEALDIARRATDRFPMTPAAWADLARVHQIRGEPREEMAALEHALQISPGWTQAICRLATAHENLGDLARSRTLLERATAWHPLDAVAHGCLAHVLWRMGEKEAAMARMEQAVLLDSSYEWAWGRLQEWALEQGKPDLAVEMARKLTITRSGEARSWLRLSRMLGGSGSFEERLSCLEKAIELEPRNEEVHDEHASVLSEAGRFQEAIAACAPAVWADDPPLQLRARRAWVEKQKGNLPEAIRRMREVVSQDGSYIWAWRHLANWHREMHQKEEHARAADKLVELAPLDSFSLTHLGLARLWDGQREEGKACFRRSLRLSPGAMFPGMALIRAEMKDERFLEAKQAVDDLLQHTGDPSLHACKVEIAALKQDREGATAALRTMCFARMQDPGPLQSARDEMLARGWALDAIQVLEDAVEKSTPNEHVGPVWAQTCVRNRSWYVGPKLEKLHAGGKLDERSIAAYLEALGDGPERTGFRRFQKRNESLLRESTSLWGWTGYVLMRMSNTLEVVDWLSDWRDRPDAEPWMLLNLVLALRYLYREAEAEEVSRHASSLPEDHTSCSHQAWVAFGDALAGRIEEARARVNSLEGEDLPSACRLISKLSEILIDIEALSSKPGKKPESIFRRWRRAPNFCRGYRKHVPLRRAYWACGRKVAKACGGLPGWAWYVIATVAWVTGTDLKRRLSRKLIG